MAPTIHRPQRDANATAIQLLNELDARQDDLLNQLAELESRIASVFDQWGIRMESADEAGIDEPAE